VLAKGGVPPLRGATLRVRLLDVTYADAPSQVVAEQAVPVEHPGGEGVLAEFAIELPAVDPRVHYAVAAEVEPPAGAELPLIATSVRYSVLTYGAGTEATLEVRVLS
jgi:uncharacterized lipoprotein YbaY